MRSIGISRMVAPALLVALAPAGAQAHLAGTVYKPVYRHIASYDCSGQFKQVPDLDQHPALFECEAVVTEFDILCANPQGKVNRGNSGPRTVSQVAEAALTNADLTDKKKGLASKTLKLPDTVLEEADAYCKDRNRNWSAVDELVLTADVTLRTYSCLDDTCTELEQATEALLRCTLPDGYDIVDNPPPGGGVATPYDCELLAEAHCDKGDGCPIVFTEALGATSAGAVDASPTAPSTGGCQAAGGASLAGLAVAALSLLRRSRRR